jgi:anti-sigma factor RsiW
VPWPSETGEARHGLTPDALREAERHLGSCADCSRKVSKYRRIVNRLSNEATEPLREDSKALLPLVAAQHAHSGFTGPRTRHFVGWLALVVVIGVSGTKPPSLSGPKFAEFAVRTHREHAQGEFALEFHSDSLQELNEWFKAHSPFSVALPASTAAPGEKRPYRLEGARLVQAGRKTAAFVAYQAQTPAAAASLIVAPDSVAVASGGIEVDFKTVNFHYATVEDYKVVTWSAHGLTYALVSQEGHGTQRSCMVCHSEIRDRDLSQTPAPLRAERNAPQPVWQ